MTLSSAHGTSRRPDQRRKGPLPGVEREESLRARLDAIDPKKTFSVPHSITASAREPHRGNFEAERLGGLEVDEQMKFRRQHDREVTRFFALHNAANVVGRLATGAVSAGAVADQVAGFGLLAEAPFSSSCRYKGRTSCHGR